MTENKGSGNDTAIDKMDQPLSNLIVIPLALLVSVLMAVFILPFAGDWCWVEGWIFVGLFTLYFLFSFLSLNKKNPRVLRNRMKPRKEKKMEDKRSEKASESDKFILPILGFTFFLTFVIADLDHPNNWSGAFPIWLEVVGFIILCIGIYILHLSMLQNAYASKVLDIREGQQLIDTGLYAHIRHPLYSGIVGMIVGIPLGLGSWWGLIPAIGCILSIVLRIKYEEEMLLTGLEGYKEYRERVKYKLIPKIY
jgi:protein-S-isoprenylcysteine O-methyltransferase Ste14